MPDKRRHQRNHEQPEHTSGSVHGPRPFWSGSIAFGLVNLPVGLFPAHRGKPLSLHMVDPAGMPLSRRYYCQREQRALNSDQLVRGREIEKDRFIEVSDEELEALAPERSQEIDLKRFVGREEIDPMYFERAYFLTPDNGAIKAYRLLAHSLERSGRAGVATFVMRGREHVVAIIAEGGILRAETLRFHDELRSPEDIGLPERKKANKADVRRLEQAIGRQSMNQLDRGQLRDHYSERVLEHVRAKLERDEDVLEPTREAPAEENGEVVDLMAVIKQSLSSGRTPNERRPRRSRQSGKGKDQRSLSTQGSQRHRSNGDDTGLASLSKQALYDRAGELDISGRSRMNKAQLVEAISRAQ